MRKSSYFLLSAACLLLSPCALSKSQTYTDALLSSINHTWQAPCGNNLPTPTAQIQAAIHQVVYYGGGELNLQCYNKGVTITSDVFSSVTAPITLVLPAAQVMVAANTTIGSNWLIIYADGSSIDAAPGYTITNNSQPYRSANGFQQLVWAPTAPSLSPTTGGSFTPPITLYYVITATVSGGGETNGSAESTISLTSGQTAVSLSWTAIANATGYKIYRGSTSLGENVYYTSATNSFTDTDGTSTAGTPPVTNTAWIPVAGGSGSGTVTSVNVAAPTFFTSTGGPITTSGIITLGYATGLTSNENMVLAVSATGAAGLMSITGAMLPLPTISTLGGVESLTCSGGQFLNAINTSGVPVCGTPSGGITLQTNSGNNSSQSLLNIETSTTNAVGLTITPSNPSGGIEKWEITGNSYTGNATTATNLASYPTLCSGGQFSQGLSSGSNNCATPSGGVTLQTNGSNNSSQTLLNAETSTTNAVGLTVTPSNPSGGVEKWEITGGSYTGNAVTATNLSSYPTLCSGGQFSQGLSSGSNNCATPSSSGTINAASQYSGTYYSGSGSSSTLSGDAAPTTNGFWVRGYNITGSAAVAPGSYLAGITNRTVTGTTDTILYSDDTNRVNYVGSANVATSLPTSTTLGNSHFATRLANNMLGDTVTVTPASSWLINGGANLPILSGQICTITVDSAGGAWDADCTEQTLTAGTNITLLRTGYGLTIEASGTTFQANGTGLLSSSTINFENGSGITVSNPSAGNIQFTDLVGTASDVTGQSTSQSTVTLATSPTPGNYRIFFYADLNTPCTTGENSVSFTINWTDATQARSLTTGSLNMSSSNQAASYLNGPFSIYVGSGNVTYASTVLGTCTTGTSEYDVHASLRQP